LVGSGLAIGTIACRCLVELTHELAVRGSQVQVVGLEALARGRGGSGCYRWLVGGRVNVRAKVEMAVDERAVHSRPGCDRGDRDLDAFCSHGLQRLGYAGSAGIDVEASGDRQRAGTGRVSWLPFL
jgi:hypothetical protein